MIPTSCWNEQFAAFVPGYMMEIQGNRRKNAVFEKLMV